jgi:type VI secretion system secreted protein Hcp
MAFSICIKIDDIKGESNLKGHAGEIDVLTWNWGITQTASGHVGSGAGTGKADVKDLTFTKHVDKATPVLLQYCNLGKAFKQALLTVTKVSGDAKPLEFIKMTMTGSVFISAVHSGDPLPDETYSETVSLNFGNAKFEYTPQKADGSADSPVVGEIVIAPVA